MILSALRMHFRLRFAEWIVGIGLFSMGLTLLCSPGLFESNYLFSGMLKLLSQTQWMFATFIVAGIRLTFLTINGVWRRSAHLRAVGSGLSALIWTAMWGSYLTLGAVLPILAILGILIALDIYSLWYATEDAANSDVKTREERFMGEVNRRTL